MTGVGIVTGMAVEVRCLSHHSPSTVQIRNAYGDPIAAAQFLVDQGASSLMSFGIAGGLDPALAPGSIVIATEILDTDGERLDCHATWRDGLVSALVSLSPVAARVLGSDSALATVGDKKLMFARHHTVAVDMESHAVARVAMRAGVPFAAIRAIADPAERSLPSAALAGLSDQGEPQIASVLWELIRHPRQLPDLLRVARNTKTALAALRCCVDENNFLFSGG